MSRHRAPWYEIRFDHVGLHKPLPLNAQAGSLDILGGKIYRYAKRFLVSNDVTVQFTSGDTESGTGVVYAGGRIIGNFTWAIQAPMYDSYGTRLRPGAHPEGLDDL